MEKMEVYGTEQSDRVKQKWNREFWTVLFYVSFFFSFLFSVEFPPQRDAVRLMFGKYFPRLSSLFTWLATFPVFHLKECSYRIQKSKQSIYISFLLSIQFCIEKYVFVNFLFFLFFLFKFQMSLCGSRAYSICSYMCWASIMSKYLASMIWGSTLFLNTEQR